MRVILNRPLLNKHSYGFNLFKFLTQCIYFVGTDSGSPLLGYLEQESAAVSNIKDGTSTPDQELDKLEDMIKHPVGSEREQQKMIYNELKKLLKEQQVEDNEKQSGKSRTKEKLIEQMRQEKLETDLTKDIDDDKNKQRVHEHTLTGTYFNPDDDTLLKQFRQFMKMYQEKKPVTAGLTVQQDENVETAKPKPVISSLMKNEEKHESNTDANERVSQETDLLDPKSIEEQLKEIQLQKEMLKNREERLKSLSAQEFKSNSNTKLDPVAKLKEETTEHTDHKLHLTKPAEDLREEKKILDHKLHLTQEALSAMPESSLDIRPEVVEPDQESKLSSSEKTFYSGVKETDKLTESTLKETQALLSPDKILKKSEDRIKDSSSFGVTQKETGNKNEKVSKAPIENESNYNSANKNNIVNTTKPSHTSWKEMKIPENETSTESLKTGTVKMEPSSHNANVNKVTHNINTQILNEKQLNKNVSNIAEEKLGLPINNPKPNAEVGYQPHANFHATFHSPQTSSSNHFRNSNSISPVHLTNQNTDSSLIQVMPEIKINSKESNQNTGSLLQIKHFRHKEPSITNAESNSGSIVPPAGMGRPRTSHVTDIMEPPLIAYRTDSNHRAILNSPNKPLIGFPFNAFHKSENEMEDIKNFLKHKTIPSRPGISKLRFIKPKSTFYKVDVIGTKKGFGKLPKKPKSYLLKELKQKLHLIALKRHLERSLLRRMHRHKYLTALKRNSTHIRRNDLKFGNNMSTVLVPTSSKNSFNNKTQEIKNIIIPGSKYRFFKESNIKLELDDALLNPGDITRSILPKANLTSTIGSTTNRTDSIEDVFNILGSDSQVNRRSFIPKITHRRFRKLLMADP